MVVPLTAVGDMAGTAEKIVEKWLLQSQWALVMHYRGSLVPDFCAVKTVGELVDVSC